MAKAMMRKHSFVSVKQVCRTACSRESKRNMGEDRVLETAAQKRRARDPQPNESHWFYRIAYDSAVSKSHLPCSCIFCKNLITTLELGRIRTCRRPRFSALEIVFRQSAKTDIRTIYKRYCTNKNGVRYTVLATHSRVGERTSRQPQQFHAVTPSPSSQAPIFPTMPTSNIPHTFYIDTPCFECLGPFGLNKNTENSVIYHETGDNRCLYSNKAN